MIECCHVESRHTQHHRRVHGGGETEAAIRIAVLTLSAQAITSPELLPLQGLIRVTRLVQLALHALQLFRRIPSRHMATIAAKLLQKSSLRQLHVPTTAAHIACQL